MSYFVKVAGTGESPITNPDWFAVHRRWGKENGHFSGFSRCPKVEPGDRFVIYAAGSGQVFGKPCIYSVEEVTSCPSLGTHKRWKWAVETRVVVPGPLLTHAPTLTDIEVQPKSIRSQSHIRLTDEQGCHAEELIQRAAEKYGSPYSREVDDADRRDAKTRDPRPSAQEKHERRARIEAIKASGTRSRMPELDAGLRTRGR